MKDAKIDLAKSEPTVKKDDKRRADETVVAKTSIAKRENKNNSPEQGKNIDHQTSNSNDIAEASLLNLKKDNSTIQTNQSKAINADFHNQDVTPKADLTLYIPEADEREKGGIKEFLRKTTRVFERRTRIQTTTDDNKLLVGAFAVSLK